MLFLLPLLLSSWPAATAVRIFGAGNLTDSTSGAQPYRYEINQFKSAGPAFDLYILALSAFQARDEADQMSYFQIAGIHGYPEAAWDGVSGSGSYPGYCMHASELFTTWHRPYLALFEQEVWQEAQTIAAQYPNSSLSTYQSAAKSLRIPYWDSVVNPSLPDVATTPQITVTTPSGQQAIDNPLYNYTFKRDATTNGLPSGNALSSFPATVRHWTGSESDQAAASSALEANAASNMGITYKFFTTVSDFITFCTAAQLPNQTDNSGTNVENVHNNIHNSLGGYGHMTDPTMAAFDPMFWLHHVNVDRWLAMWQALYPDSYVIEEVNNYGSYYEVTGTTDTITTSLAPFHDTDAGTTMWTSEGIRSLSAFRYSYPELPYWSMTADELATNVRNQVNTLYNSGSSSTRKRSASAVGPRGSSRRKGSLDAFGGFSLPKGHSSISKSFGGIDFDFFRRFGANNANRQWFAKITLEKYAVDTAFTILLFMGDPPSDANQWTTASNLVGTLASFIAFNGSSIFPDGTPTGKTQGEISLTHTLLGGVDRGLIPNLLPEAVLPLLKTGLKWRAQAVDGTVIPLAKVSGLTIDVGTQAVKPTNHSDLFPVYDAIDWYSNLM